MVYRRNIQFCGVPVLIGGYQQYNKSTMIINNTKVNRRALINDGDIISVTREMRVLSNIPRKEREHFRIVVNYQL